MIYGGRFILFGKNQTTQAVSFLAELTFYADFYGLLPIVASSSSNLLISVKDSWEDVAKNSVHYLGLRFLLRSPDIFTDAIRHCVGKVMLQRQPRERYDKDGAVLDNEIKLLDNEVKLLEMQKSRELSLRMEQVNNRLHRILVPESFYSHVSRRR